MHAELRDLRRSPDEDILLTIQEYDGKEPFVLRTKLPQGKWVWPNRVKYDLPPRFASASYEPFNPNTRLRVRYYVKAN